MSPEEAMSKAIMDAMKQGKSNVDFGAFMFEQGRIYERKLIGQKLKEIQKPDTDDRLALLSYDQQLQQQAIDKYMLIHDLSEDDAERVWAVTTWLIRQLNAVRPLVDKQRFETETLTFGEILRHATGIVHELTELYNEERNEA